MLNEALDEADPIWGAMPATVAAWDDYGRQVECARAGGRYRITSEALEGLSKLTKYEKAHLTTLIVDSNRMGEPLTVSSEMLQRARAARSFTVQEQIDRLLLYFVHLGFRPGTPPFWLNAHVQSAQTVKVVQEAAAWIEAVDDNEVAALGDVLDSAGLLKKTDASVTITAAGFARMDELRRGGAPTLNAFVAMWFDAETVAAYDEGIEPAIVETGFNPVRIDRKEHVNKIDDEIVAEIKRSRFVVADFTSPMMKIGKKVIYVPRGGVYYEAGLAQGRDIPVIWTVRSDQIDQVHFDTRQFNHIVWDNPEHLREKLRNRIRALFAEAT